MESYQGRLKTDYKHGKISHELTLGTFGSTACPHALASSTDNRTHIQRAYGEVTLKGETSEIPDMEVISEILDQSFSSPTYSLLKSEDEQWVINQMFKNPLFVEDVTRNLLKNIASVFNDHKLEITARVTSLESIHKHNVVSKGSTTTCTNREDR
jgi:GTP cyclohydrolase-4